MKVKSFEYEETSSFRWIYWRGKMFYCVHTIRNGGGIYSRKYASRFARKWSGREIQLREYVGTFDSHDIFCVDLFVGMED